MYVRKIPFFVSKTIFVPKKLYSCSYNIVDWTHEKINVPSYSFLYHRRLHRRTLCLQKFLKKDLFQFRQYFPILCARILGDLLQTDFFWNVVSCVQFRDTLFFDEPNSRHPVPWWTNSESRPGGVAQWTSYPPQEREDPGSNPARVKVFLVERNSAVVCKMT
jgi:hypothetical protein